MLLISRTRANQWALAAVLSTTVFSLLLGKLIAQAAALSWRIPGNDLGGDYLTGVLWSIVLAVSLILWPIHHRDRVALAGLWAAKCVVCLGVMLFYESQYGLDAFNYFDFARETAGAPEIVIKSGTAYILWLTSLHYRLMPSYHAIKTTYSYLGLMGIYAFYRTVTLLRPQIGRGALLLIGLFPTVLFWSSILGKDPIVFLGMGLYCLGIAKWQQHKMASALIYIVLGGVIATTIRLWFGLIMAVPMIALSLVHTRSLSRRWLTVTLSTILLWVAFQVFHDRYVLDSALDILQATGSIVNTFGIGGASSRAITMDVSTIPGLIKFLPIGMFAALFRPLPGEVLSSFGSIASAENGVLITLLVLTIGRFRIAILKEPMVVWALTLILVWSMFYALVSYQNFGAALRYKLPIVPILLTVLIRLSRVFPTADSEESDLTAPSPE
jgi:hypothetical protein